MKDKDTNELLELGGVLKEGYSSLMANGGRVIAIITLSMAILLTFTDLTISDIGTEKFGATLFVMLISSYMMYFSLEDSGEREGEMCSEFISAKERFLKAKSAVTPDRIDALRSFCLDYSLKELQFRRLGYLSENGYSLSDYNGYKSGEKCSFRANLIFRRADRMRAVRLTPQTLLTLSHQSTKSELINPVYKKIGGALLSLIPSTVCMIFTISVILTAKDGQNVYTVLNGILKLSALPIVGFKGALDGYCFSKEYKSSWLEAKARIIEAFLEQETV